jgi:hypothetical protein
MIASRLLRPFHIYNLSIDLEKSLYIVTKHSQTGHDRGGGVKNCRFYAVDGDDNFSKQKCRRKIASRQIIDDYVGN